MWFCPWLFTPTQATRTVSLGLASALALTEAAAAAELIRKCLRSIGLSPLLRSNSSQFVRRPVLVRQQAVGGLIVGEALGVPIPFEQAAGLVRDVANQGARRGNVADQDIGITLGAALHAIQKVPRVGLGAF